MRALERKTEPALQHKARKTPKAQATFELKTHLESICGVDLTAVPGLEVLSVQALISEIGLDMTRWKSDKEFCSWLRLCPGNRISGSKRSRMKPQRGHNRPRISCASVPRAHSRAKPPSAPSAGACAPASTRPKRSKPSRTRSRD